MPRQKIDGFLWEVGADLGGMVDEMNRGRPRFARNRSWEPRVDVVEEEDRFLVKAEIAGVRAQDISLTYVPERHSLVIRGYREDETVSEGPQVVHQIEIFYGQFRREVLLPDHAVDAHSIRAQYRNGFLLVVVPKVAARVTRGATVVGSL